MIDLQTQILDEWTRIHNRDCPYYLEQRAQPLSDATLAAILALEPFSQRFAGPIAALDAHLNDFPDDLTNDVSDLANRFADMMAINEVRLRIERVDTNACKKVHADYTDVRLITTYAGPGTDIALHGKDGCCMDRVPTCWIGLFKGRTYAQDHPPCFHRSPPVGDTGEKRLLLVIDTPPQAQM